MSIEDNLTRIADALEKQNEITAFLLDKLSHLGQAVEAPTTSAAQVSATVATPPAPAAPVTPPPAAPVTPPPAAPVTPPPAAPVAETTSVMTPEELNAALIIEFNRLGSREGIDACMKELDVMSLHDLTADKYDTLLTKVKAL